MINGPELNDAIVKMTTMPHHRFIPVRKIYADTEKIYLISNSLGSDFRVLSECKEQFDE